MLWVAVYTFMKPAYSWPGACFSLQVAEGGAETIRASKPSIDRTCIAALGRGANVRAAGQQRLARTRRRALVWLLASAMAALGTADAFAASRHKHVPAHQSKAAEAERHKHRSAPDAKRSAAARQSERTRAAHMIVPSIPLPIARPAAASLPPDLAATKQAIELVRQGKPSEATLIATSIGDPVAQKLVEWTLLRHPESEVRIRALHCLHPCQSQLAEHSAAAPARGGEAVAGPARRRHGPPLLRRGTTDQPVRPACVCAHAESRGRSGRRCARSSRGMAVGGTVGRAGGRRARRVPRRADPRRPRGTHGLAHQRQRLRCGDARCKASRRR